MTVASSAEPSRDPGPAPEGARPSSSEVTITITGAIAEDMIGRGEEQERRMADLARRLEAVQEAAAQGAAEREQLGRSIEELKGQLALLKGQMAEQVEQLRTEVASVRGGVMDVGGRLRELQDKMQSVVTRVQGQANDVHGRASQVSEEVGNLQADLDKLRTRVGKLESGGFLTSVADGLKRLHLGLWVGGVVTLAAAGAVLLYA